MQSPESTSPRCTHTPPEGQRRSQPQALWSRDRWVCCTSDHGRKVPCGARVYGKIDITDQANWTDYATAAAAAESVYYDGVGFVLGDGVAGIDLDDCRNVATGVLTAKAEAIV